MSENSNEIPVEVDGFVEGQQHSLVNIDLSVGRFRRYQHAANLYTHAHTYTQHTQVG